MSKQSTHLLAIHCVWWDIKFVNSKKQKSERQLSNKNSVSYHTFRFTHKSQGVCNSACSGIIFNSGEV